MIQKYEIYLGKSCTQKEPRKNDLKCRSQTLVQAAMHSSKKVLFKGKKLLVSSGDEWLFSKVRL